MVFVGRRACLTPEDLLARLAVVFDLVGLLFVFLFFGMAAVYHWDRPVVSDVCGKLIVIYSGVHSFRSLALQSRIRCACCVPSISSIMPETTITRTSNSFQAIPTCT